MQFNIELLIKATKGTLYSNNNNENAFNICTDTRIISSKDAFLPLVGANFDGHDFIKTAIEKGTTVVFVDKAHSQLIQQLVKSNITIIKVNDTIEAYLNIANIARNIINPKIIGVTGSSGKTTTKEMLYSVISQQFKSHKSKLNHNNEIGLCQTLLQMPEDTECTVLEMGMRGLGEIELLSKHAQPDFSIITNVGTAHIGRLGSIENIAAAKCEIAKFTNSQGAIISHNSDFVKNILDFDGKIIYYDINDSKIIYNQGEIAKFEYKNFEYELNVSGEYNILNALSVIETGLLLGIPPEKINAGLISYQPIENRWQITEIQNNSKIINDSYNANPDSVKASINAVIDAYSKSNIYLILGDMGELGQFEEELHREIGQFINKKNIKQLITVGEKAKLITECIDNQKIGIKAFTKNDEVVKYLLNNLEENSVVLIKASRSMAFDEIAEKILGV